MEESIDGTTDKIIGLSARLISQIIVFIVTDIIEAHKNIEQDVSQEDKKERRQHI